MVKTNLHRFTDKTIRFILGILGVEGAKVLDDWLTNNFDELIISTWFHSQEILNLNMPIEELEAYSRNKAAHSIAKAILKKGDMLREERMKLEDGTLKATYYLTVYNNKEINQEEKIKIRK